MTQGIPIPIGPASVVYVGAWTKPSDQHALSSAINVNPSGRWRAKPVGEKQATSAVSAPWGLVAGSTS